MYSLCILDDKDTGSVAANGGQEWWSKHSADSVPAPQEQQLTDLYHMLELPAELQ